MKTPERHHWGVELLSPRPAEHVLEVGCGRGVAALLLCEILTIGSYTGIDRSAQAIEAAVRKNAAAVARGRASFRLMSFGTGEADGQAFDQVLAINVNRFWQSATNESAIWRPTLKPGARIVLVYEGPPGASLERQISGSRHYLGESGFDRIEVRASEAERPLVGITAHWPAE